MEALRRCSGVLFVALLFVRLIAASSLQADGSVIFVDSSVGPEYLRRTPAAEKEVFSYDDVATSLAVLLGVVPGVSIDENVAAKVDSVVSPNPFQRPRAVISLNIGGVESDLINNGETLDSLGLKLYQQRAFVAKDSHVSQISGDGLNLRLLTNLDAVDLNAEISEQDFQAEFVFMSASYNLDGDSKTVTTVSWDMSNGETFTLDTTKTADRLFFKELMGIFRNMQRAVSSQQPIDLEEPANLYFGNFNGIEELRKAYGSGHQTQLASKFVLYAMNQALQFLQDNYNDKLVGVFTFTKSSNDFEITVSERRARFLQDADAAIAAPTGSPGNETYPEQMALHLGNQAVVFFTVLILLLALVLSTCCMFTMPLTRDSLLYSGLKLD
ncbi:hypothetical protein KC19_6G010200 [Ceratodon purpureus]|uniref:DUF7794 domain-containing protein n=1 Tax=Ceratodon purpureus TaxID=3225 RepID=A0A8T0HBK7_CERPU|nr:hypothetical protein KC19_6G010200 [Ceratodon purpureus]